MAVTAFWYGNSMLAAFDKEIDFLADNIAVTLHTVSYVPDQDAHDYADDLSNEVANGNGYTTGGQNLASKANTYTAGTNVVMFDAADVQWTTANFTARVAVLTDTTPGSAGTNPLLVYQLSDANIVASGGNFDLVWHANGIARITLS